LTSGVLARSGYKVLSAHNGIEAIGIARSLDGPIHLLLTDIMMPKLNGHSLARHVSALRPGIRVIFMTGHCDVDETPQDAVPSENECLRKPFHRDTLIRKVRQALDLAEMQVRG